MNSALHTQLTCEVFEKIKPLSRLALLSINDLDFSKCRDCVSTLRAQLASARDTLSCPTEDQLNDLFVLSRYIDFISSYVDLWESVVFEKFSDSWTSLQDSLDLLRLLKKFSSIDIDFFESQLLELERAYPYGLFCSIGVTVDHFECSICGQDIDTEQCSHVRGMLYSGRMAQGIAREITQVHEVSLVTHPEDKRCVVQYDDEGEQFNLIRYLSRLIAEKRFPITYFGVLEFSKKKRANSEYKRLSRNEICFCGSGKKFKRCCIAREYVEGDHVDIVARPCSIEDVVA